MNDELLKQQLEGKISGTSPEEDQVGLNNATSPTAEEEEHAGIENVDEQEGEMNPQGELGAEQETEPGAAPIPEEVDADSHVEPELGIAEASTEKMFTQSQVDEIAGKARKEGREKALRDIYYRYGVNTEEELDDIFGDAQKFMTVQDEMKAKSKAWEEADLARNSELEQLKEQIALLQSGIDKNRYEDAKFILKGKGMEVTMENIEQELATHPEWKSEAAKNEPMSNLPPFLRKSPTPAPQPEPEPAPATSINVLGNSGADVKAPEKTDYEKAMDMFFRK